MYGTLLASQEGPCSMEFTSYI